MLREEEEEMEDPTAHEAISVADWKAQNCDKGKRSPRQAMHGTCVRCRVCTDGAHPNATTAASSAAMKKGSHLGCVDRKLGDHA